MSRRDSMHDAVRDYIENFAGSDTPRFAEVGVGSDFKQYEDSSGDHVIEHTPSGRTFTLQSDGEFVSDSLSTDSLLPKLFNNRRVVGDGPLQFNTIQAAHDDLPSGGGVVEYTSGYDSSNENFPLNWTKRGMLVGDGQTEIHNSGSTDDVIEIKVEGANDPPTVTFRDVRVRGGNNGVVVNGTPHVNLWHVDVQDCSNDGVRADEFNGRSSHSVSCFDVNVHDVGGTGFFDATDSGGGLAHAWDLTSCMVEGCTDYGLRWGDSGSLSIHGGVYQDNGAYGMFLTGPDSVRIYGPYMEGNNERGGFASSIVLEDVNAATIDGLFVNGFGDINGAVLITEDSGTSRKISVKDVFATNVNNNVINVSAGQEIETYSTTHRTNVSTNIVAAGGGTRVRSHGVIGGGHVGGSDLTSENGQFVGDLGVHDGTGTVPACNCRWDGSNWRPFDSVSFTYSGDGSTGRTIAGNFQFETVVVEEGGGAVVDAYVGGLSNGAMSGSTFTGGLTVESSGGFTVGDNGGDADPNTNGETYQVYAQ